MAFSPFGTCDAAPAIYFVGPKIADAGKGVGPAIGAAAELALSSCPTVGTLRGTLRGGAGAIEAGVDVSHGSSGRTAVQTTVHKIWQLKFWRGLPLTDDNSIKRKHSKPLELLERFRGD